MQWRYDPLTLINIGKRSNLFTDMKCLSKSRDDDKMLCSDGTLGNKWNGCQENDQIRVQCPSGFTPCNALRGKSNGKEFVCSEFNCEKLGGIRDCEGKPLKLLLYFTFPSAELRCLSESRLDDKLLCSDGSVENKWDGCVDKGSVRVQCPKGFVPCNKLRDNGVEFKCGTDCSRNGGQRSCFGIL